MRPKRPRKDRDDHERWLRLQAVQVAAMLPEGHADALRVLALAHELVDNFLNSGSNVETLGES
jgi:hypothetical protein